MCIHRDTDNSCLLIKPKLSQCCLPSFFPHVLEYLFNCFPYMYTILYIYTYIYVYIEILIINVSLPNESSANVAYTHFAQMC